jgi:hypothetical protein
LFAYYLLNRVIESNSVMDAEEIKSHAKRRASAYRDLANSLDMNDVSRKIARTKGRGKIGKSLMKAGIALIAVPDPITDVPGIIMVGGGYIISRLWEANGITDIQKELRKTIASIEELKVIQNGF